jgi:CRISPR-associated endoribonuclease Cas6
MDALYENYNPVIFTGQIGRYCGKADKTRINIMTLDIKYSKITLKTDVCLENYDFLGSTIRGAFGVGLKKTVCINPSYKCGECFAMDGCVFYAFFEKQNPKYRLNIEVGNKLKFDLFLFEQYTVQAPYIIRALHEAFAENGITKKRIKPDFIIEYNGQTVYNGRFLNFKNSAMKAEIPEMKNEFKVFFKTPLRIKHNNVFLRNSLEMKAVLRNIWHRYRMLKGLEIIKMPFEPVFEIKEKVFEYKEFRRYSNRQKTAMFFGGITGFVEISADDNVYKLLKLGEIIGVGKQVTFGFGNIKVV